MKHRVLVVDDEPKAVQILELYIGKMLDLEVAGVCRNALEALHFLQNNKVDILFLDIKMPQLSGLDLIRTINRAPKIIITTAFADHALEGFDLGVADYLLKPFSFERFVKAVHRVLQYPQGEAAISEEPKFIFVKVESQKIEKIMVSDIDYVEAYGNYVKIHTAEKIRLVADTMQAMESLLPARLFARVHKSFIISLDKVQTYDNTSVKVSSRIFSVGKIYRRTFLEKMKVVRSS